CSNSVGVGLGSCVGDEPSGPNNEHPDRTRASATTPPWILLLRFTPTTLPCPGGINNFHSPCRDAPTAPPRDATPPHPYRPSCPNPHPPRYPTSGHGIV